MPGLCIRTSWVLLEVHRRVILSSPAHVKPIDSTTIIRYGYPLIIGIYLDLILNRSNASGERSAPVYMLCTDTGVHRNYVHGQ